MSDERYSVTIDVPVHIVLGRRGRKELRAGPPTEPVATTGLVPRVSRLLAVGSIN